MTRIRPRRRRNIREFRLAAAAGLAVVLFSTSCSNTSTLNLMPTPLVHQYLGAEAYSELPSSERSQDMEIFYATNRPGSESEGEQNYGNGIVDKLQLGTATIRLGERGINWKDVLDFSTLRDRKDKVPLHLDATRELDALPGSDGAAFAKKINAVLAKQKRPDITIYVHGASSSFFRSTTQGAQFHHFMARQTALIAYSWPSTGKFISYKKDVGFAAQSADNLADLIEFLAANTRARKINLLVYSAGGQVVGPGLAQLRKRYPDVSDLDLKRRFRIGDVYFAAADVSLDKFVDEYLPIFDDIVEKVTVTYHAKDGILGFAQSSNEGEARLGRPDKAKITEEQYARLHALAKEGKLDAIDMEYSTAERPVDFKAHGHWYLNEWVSSDAILQFLMHDDPSARGLEKKPDSEAWFFPADYPDRLKGLVEEAQAEEAR
jgi:esterase/lipase superfamily enzyme